MRKIIVIVSDVLAVITVFLFIGLSSPHIMGKDEVYITTKTVITEKISINTASKLELMRIPDIGETTADKIIAYRDENNGFNSLEELMNVKGIGEKTYNKFFRYLKI